MTPENIQTQIPVSDSRSLAYLDCLVGLSQTMMEHALLSPLALGRFTQHAIEGVSMRFLPDDQGVSHTFDFSHHQGHPFSLSLVVPRVGSNHWIARLHRTDLMTRPTSCDPLQPLGIWTFITSGFCNALEDRVATYLSEVYDWSRLLMADLENPQFLKAALDERKRRIAREPATIQSELLPSFLTESKKSC